MRPILFLGGCMVTRLALSYLAWRWPNYAQMLAPLALVPAMGWLYIYFVSGRETGAEVFGDKIWWNQLRIPHAMLYMLFALYAHQGQTYSWVPLLVDALLGLLSWTVYFFSTRV